MGTALLRGWLGRGLKPLAVVEPNPAAELTALAASARLPVYRDIADLGTARVRACVVAIKPQVLKAEAIRLKPLAQNGALILSIAAGTSIATLKKAVGRSASVVRAMPNLPGAVGKGISGLFAPRTISTAHHALAETLLSALGKTVWVNREGLIDSVTAVSGSGPAYVFLVTEALSRAAIAEGLSPAIAAELARATVTGAAALLETDRRPPEQLRHDVTSPGGTTEAALGILMDGDALERLIARAVQAARLRAEELSR